MVRLIHQMTTLLIYTSILVVDLNCETCVQFWASYGVAFREPGHADSPEVKDVLRAKIDAASESICMHDLAEHSPRQAEVSKAASA